MPRSNPHTGCISPMDLSQRPAARRTCPYSGEHVLGAGDLISGRVKPTVDADVERSHTLVVRKPLMKIVLSQGSNIHPLLAVAIDLPSAVLTR